MSEILLHFQSQQFEIGGIADNDGHIDVMFFVHLDTHRHVDHSGNSTADTSTCHKRQLFHLVLEKLHCIIVLRGILDVIKIVCGCMHRPCQHVPHLHFHHQGKSNQENGEDVLYNDEYFAHDHFAAPPECAFDHVDRLVARG